MATTGILNQTNLVFKTGVIEDLKLDAANGYLRFGPIATPLVTATATADTLSLSGSTGGTRVTIANVETPTTDYQAANKYYVDSKVNGLSWKQAVQGATTALITLGSAGDGSQLATSSIDGLTYTVANVGYRLLVKDQGGNDTTPAVGNGIYVLTLCTNPSFFYWTRSADCASGSEASNASCFVKEGTLNQDTAWTCTTNSATFGTTAIVFVRFANGGGGSAAGPTNAVQISANGSGSFNGISAFTFNQSTSAPDMEIGADSTSTSSVIGVGTGTSQTSSTVNIGTGSSSSTATLNIGTSNNATSSINLSQGSGTTNISGNGTGLMTIAGSGAFRMTAGITQAVQLFNTSTTGNMTVGTGLTTGSLTLGSASSGSMVLSSAGSTLTIVGTFSASATAAVTLFNTNTTTNITLGGGLTSGLLTLGNVSGSGSLVLSNVGSTLTSTSSFTAVAAAGSNVNLFNTTTTGNISSGSGLTSGTLSLGNSSMSGTITLNNAGTINVGSGNSTTVNIGGSSTTSVGISATGSAGLINLTSGTGAISLTTSNSTGSTGGVNLTTGNVTTSGTAGDITLTPGTSTVSGSGGNTVIKASAGSSVANNGNIKLVTASNGTATGSLTTSIIGIYDSNMVLKARIEDDGVFYGSAFNAQSDETLKKNIKKIDNALEKCKKISGYTYNWKDSTKSRKRQYGVLAQDLEEEPDLRHLVSGGEIEGDKTVNYLGLIPILIESINELSKNNEMLAQRIEKYEKLLKTENDAVEEPAEKSEKRKIVRRIKHRKTGE